MVDVVLEKGLYLKVDGIPVVVEGRAADKGRYWVRPAGSGLTNRPFILDGSEIAPGLASGRITIGATEEHGIPRKDLPVKDPPDRDEAEAAYLEMIIKAVRSAKERDPSLRLTRTVLGEIAKTVPAPPGRRTPSGSTVQAKLARWSTRGRDGLVPGHCRKGNREPRKPDFVVDAVEDAIDSAYRGHGSVPRVVEEAIKIARMTVPADLSEYVRHVRKPDGSFTAVSMVPRDETGAILWEELISYHFVYNAIQRRTAFERAAMSEGKDEAERAFRPVGPGVTGRRPLDRVEMDNFRLPIFAVDAGRRLPLGVPWVTVLLDTCTRVVLGMHIGFMPPSGDTVGQCLAHAIMPKSIDTSLKGTNGKLLFKHGWVQFGRPRTIACDLGPDQIAQSTRDNCYRIGVELLPLKVRRPQMKGKIERFIRTLKRGELGHLLGIIPRKGGKPPKDRQLVVTLEELWLLLQYWVTAVYHQRRHTGIGMTPAEAWERNAELRLENLPPPADDLKLICGNYAVRTVDRHGIRIFGLHYNSADLARVRAQLADPDGRMRDVTIKYDPSDISAVWLLFEDPKRPGKTISVRADCTRLDYARDLSLHAHLVIKEHAKRSHPRGVITVPQLIAAKLELIEICKKIMGARDKDQNYVKVAEFMGVGRKSLSVTEEDYDPSASASLFAEILEVDLAPQMGAATPRSNRGKQPREAKAPRSGDSGMAIVAERDLEPASARASRKKLGTLDV